jgi:hypothetical protein
MPGISTSINEEEQAQTEVATSKTLTVTSSAHALA